MAGPFGLEKGLKKTDLKLGNEVAPFLFEIVDVPKRHSAFPLVYARIAPENGLFAIRALGSPISTNGAGLEVKGEFDRILEKLTKTYGNPERIDQVLPGGIYTEFSDWMMSINTNERYYGSSWRKENGLELPNSIELISLDIFAEDQWSGQLRLDYTFDNSKDGNTEIDNLEDDAL